MCLVTSSCLYPDSQLQLAVHLRKEYVVKYISVLGTFLKQKDKFI